MRPTVPDHNGDKNGGKSREPHEYDAELAKYKAISDFIEKSEDLSDVTDIFHGYQAKLIALNRATGYDCSLRLLQYREYKRTSPDHLRMARNEITRLLTQPKVIVHGGELLRDDYKEPGFFASVIEGGKRMVGIKPSAEQQRHERTGGQENGRY